MPASALMPGGADSGHSSVSSGYQDSGDLYFSLASGGGSTGGIPWLPLLIILGLVAVAIAIVWRAL